MQKSIFVFIGHEENDNGKNQPRNLKHFLIRGTVFMEFVLNTSMESMQE